MIRKVMLAVSTLTLAVAGVPAIAQQTQDNDNTTTGASGNHSDNDTVVVNDLIDLFVQDNAADSWSDDDGNGSYNGASNVVAVQYLNAVNTNQYLDEVVDLDGEDESDTAVGYNSGNNSIRGNAFAAYAGIMNAAWNTGINANTQAATNIAAHGTVTFGECCAAADDTGGGGGDD